LGWVSVIYPAAPLLSKAQYPPAHGPHPPASHLLGRN
jgi:hypothetical protein